MNTNHGKENPLRERALSILREILRKQQEFVADDLYRALKDAGFSEDDRVRLIGACIRTASARDWATKTDRAQMSQRQGSNAQFLWISNLFKHRA